MYMYIDIQYKKILISYLILRSWKRYYEHFTRSLRHHICHILLHLDAYVLVHGIPGYIKVCNNIG